MTLRSPLGKAWANDALAYSGSNTWKCIIVWDRGEDGETMEWAELSIFIQKEGGNGLHHDHFQSVINMDSNPAGLILDSLNKPRLKQSDMSTPHLSYLVLMMASWYGNVVWGWNMADTALPIICALRATRDWAAALEPNEQVQHSEPLVSAILLSCGSQHWDQSARLIPHFCCRGPHALQNTPNLKHKHSHKGKSDWCLCWKKLMLSVKWWKGTVRCRAKRHWEFTVTLICVWRTEMSVE